MKLEKKHYIIIGVVIAVIAVWYFFLRKKKTTSSYATRVAPRYTPLSNYSGNEFPGIESGFTKVATGTPVNVKYPTCKRDCAKCTPSNAPCIGAGGYLVD